MTIQESLTSLGATPDVLSPEEKQFLDDQGYLPLENVLSPAQVASFNARLEELAAIESEAANSTVHSEAGAARLFNLVDKDALFALCFTHPRVLAAIAHVVGPELRLSSLNWRAALPGAGSQALHTDAGWRADASLYQACNSIWLLDDFTPENGATRVVPGTHRRVERPNDLMPDPKAAHPDERIITGAAGTVVIFNSHLWHGGTLNRTSAPRRAMHSYFCRRDHLQQTDQKASLRPQTLARLSEAAKAVLDV